MQKSVRIVYVIFFAVIMLSSAVVVEPGLVANSSSLNFTGISSLRLLVAELIKHTTNMTDTDGDTLPDSVEAVIGTDFNNTDTDFDRLSDSYEIEYDLDPLNADSNNDGLPDYYEVTDVLSLDLDGDNVTNAWDFDNDGDGVNDGLDLSPFAKSTMSNSFHFDVATNGLPGYITFQLRPQNPEYLKLLNQFWNWMDGDKEGIMKDLDNSLDDVQIVPMLNLSANIVPEQSKVIDYGITIESNHAYVPLYAVSEYGNIVAFSGKMVYPLGPPLNLSMNAELIWQVIGKSDQDTTALLAQNGRYISVINGGTVVANSSEISSRETLQWVDLGANTAAFRAFNGLYLSVADDGTIFANASEINDREMFELSDNGGGKTALKAYNGKYLTVNSDGTLTASSTKKKWSWPRYLPVADFRMIDTDVLSESFVLATYKEPFMLTGLTIEENYGSSFGLFFSHDKNQTIAANILLAYAFLRNSTTQLLEMPAILAEYDSEVFSQIDWFSHKDEALISLATEAMPHVLNALHAGAGSQILPIITSIEDRFASLDMAQLISGSYIMGAYCNATLTYEPIVTSKTLKMDLYNTTSYEVLEIDDAMVEVAQWEQDEDARYQLMSMISAWNAGEQFITSIGSNKTEFDFFGEYLDIFNDVRKYGFGAFKVYKTAFRGYEAYRIVNSALTKFAKSGGHIGGKTFKSMFKVWYANWKRIDAAKTGRFAAFKRIGYVLDMVGALIETGIALYSLFQILDSGLTPMGLNTALLKLVMTFMYSMTLAIIGVIPVVGWLISLAIALSDLIGNWSEKLFNAIIAAMTKVTAQVDPSISLVGEPSLSIIDKDGNGLDVGDRIEYYARMIGRIVSLDSWCLDASSIHPYVKIVNPAGTSSTVGYPYLTEWVFMAKDLGQKGNDIHLWLPIPPKSTWETTSGQYWLFKWRAQAYDVGGWIEPGIAMPNFPVTVQTYADYELAYKWKHFVFLVFYAFWCHHKGWNAGIMKSQTTPMGSQTFYFDVLPASLSDFVKWKSIKRLDTDFDGLKDTEENASNPSLYDTDGDGLNDKYELDTGTNPKLFDTDQDGLNDKLEIVHGTNATDTDTDGDGLSDYAEITGWISVFNYEGSQFTPPVTSNPLLLDTDDDGLNDNLECSSRLNPRSKDTDGDGIIDQERTPPDLPVSIIDSDGDGLNDNAEEVGWNIVFTNATDTYTLTVTSEPLLKDTDFDGLTDYQEYNLSSNPRTPDTDGDGLDDYLEKESGTSLTSFDTDDDGLDDGTELTLNSNPTSNDTDGDGLPDLDEINLGTDLGNNDTDSDGLSDLQEVLFGSNATLPDTDNDLLFDGQEFLLGTDPIRNDSDNDDLLDGWEIIYETNPLNNDTDNDLVLDGEEIKWSLNPTSNDTDVDELLDGIELELGTDPRNPDTDFDGLIDSEDPDTYVPNVKQVVLAFDANSDPTEFIENLSMYTNVTVVSPEELLDNYSGAPYIVLVGRPNTENGTVGNIIYNLLQDSGDTLAYMMESDAYRFAIRYGVWNNTQTIVTLSQPYFADHFRVLEILKSKNVTILPDSLTVDYQVLAAPSSEDHDYSIYFVTDEIDMIKATDSIIVVGLEESAAPRIQINRYDHTTTPYSLNESSGLSPFEKSVERYLEIKVSENVQNETNDIIEGALLQMYYTNADLDRTGDGDADDPEDFDESTLVLYCLNETSGLWTKLDTNLDWVIDVGLNTTDVELYGTHYDGYVWAYVSRLSPLYAIAGRIFNQPPDVSNAHPSIEYLWPPNHEFVNVTIEGVTDPDGDPITIEILDVTSDEPTDSTRPDAYGIGTDTAHLSAERLGKGDGRVYVITFIASDGKGGETVGSVKVYVLHDQGEYTWHGVDDR